MESAGVPRVEPKGVMVSDMPRAWLGYRVMDKSFRKRTKGIERLPDPKGLRLSAQRNLCLPTGSPYTPTLKSVDEEKLRPSESRKH